MKWRHDIKNILSGRGGVEMRELETKAREDSIDKQGNTGDILATGIVFSS